MINKEELKNATKEKSRWGETTFISGIISGISGAVVGFFTAIWKYETDLTSAVRDNFSTLVNNSSEYLNATSNYIQDTYGVYIAPYFNSFVKSLEAYKSNINWQLETVSPRPITDLEMQFYLESDKIIADAKDTLWQISADVINANQIMQNSALLGVGIGAGSFVALTAFPFTKYCIAKRKYSKLKKLSEQSEINKEVLVR